MKTGIALLMVGLLCAGNAVAQQRGDWALARWQDGQYWFPGVIESRSGNVVTIAYDDGTRETLSLDKVRPFDWAAGTRVHCRWQGGREWYPGVIRSVDRDGVGIDVAYDDGDREQTRTGACREQD